MLLRFFPTDARCVEQLVVALVGLEHDPIVVGHLV
ncbi:MAG: hypothetical protein N4J56_006558 [Chroococcidiopsis sp. SAG 2025]|nr:hypothetical protein [Chroococcidiopsis sp. SAG 2025]